MYNVSDEEIDFILDDIAKRGIVTEDVKFNILDHVCCIAENEMQTGMHFREFYEQIIVRFFHKELGEIEEETQKLLTFKNFYAMKRTLKISGVSSIILMMFGIVFKFMHWPGAAMMVVLGLGFFSLIFIPLNIMMKFKDDKKRSNQIIMTIGMLTASVASIGVLFKIMHWPYANILMFSSLLVFMLLFIPVYFIIKFKDPETKFNAIINTTFMVGAAGMLFALIDLKASRHSIEQKHNTEMQKVDKELHTLSDQN